MLADEFMNKAALFDAKVYHRRLGASSNAFRYKLFYTLLPLTTECQLPGLSRNRKGLVSFSDHDFGPRDGSSLPQWIRQHLKNQGINGFIDSVMLLSMPKMLGHGFNPVSFWFCLDKDGALRAVLCEVNNTFGQHHSYLCFHSDARAIDGCAWLETEKCFHVSPFFPRQGTYRFKFSLEGRCIRIWIHYFDVNGVRQLVTSLSGQLIPWSRFGLMRLSCRYPMIGMKTLLLIHWQAAKLWLKKAKFYKLPLQRSEKLTLSRQRELQMQDEDRAH